MNKEVKIWCEHNRNIAGIYDRCLICNPVCKRCDKLNHKIACLKLELEKHMDMLHLSKVFIHGWKK